MKWNWQQADWRHFSYDSAKIEQSEKQLLMGTGLLFGAFKHLAFLIHHEEHEVFHCPSW